MGKDKKEKKDKSEKSHSHKSHKEGKEKKEKKDHLLPFGVSRITQEDYFLKMPEFQLWLKASGNKFGSFEELPSDKSREIFQYDFIKVYNKGKLPNNYYDSSITSVSLKDIGGRTTHQWSFTKKLSDTDKIHLDDISSSIRGDTDGATGKAGIIWKEKGGKSHGGGSSSHSN